MDLFGQIVESVLSEVNSSVAYNKWYSSIPRDIYDRITGGQAEIDKFIQFFLNAVRDGKMDAEKAINFIARLKNEEQAIQQRIKQKISKNEYDADPTEIFDDIESMKSGVYSKTKFAKEGYAIIYETDQWMVTATFTYMASRHYYGDSQWCTASGRDGRYDGYQMFLSYTNMANNYTEDQFGDNPSFAAPLSISSYSVPSQGNSISTLVQFIEKNGTHKYQAVLNKDGSIGAICDFSDEQMDDGDDDNSPALEKLLSDNADNSIMTFLKDNAVKLSNITSSYYVKEAKYQRHFSQKKKAEFYVKKDEYENLINDLKKQYLTIATNAISEKKYMNVEYLQQVLEHTMNYYSGVIDYCDNTLDGCLKSLEFFKSSDFIVATEHGSGKLYMGHSIHIITLRPINCNFVNFDETDYNITFNNNPCTVHYFSDGMIRTIFFLKGREGNIESILDEYEGMSFNIMGVTEDDIVISCQEKKAYSLKKKRYIFGEYCINCDADELYIGKDVYIASNNGGFFIEYKDNTGRGVFIIKGRNASVAQFNFDNGSTIYAAVGNLWSSWKVKVRSFNILSFPPQYIKAFRIPGLNQFSTEDGLFFGVQRENGWQNCYRLTNNTYHPEIKGPIFNEDSYIEADGHTIISGKEVYDFYTNKRYERSQATNESIMKARKIIRKIEG